MASGKVRIVDFLVAHGGGVAVARGNDGVGRQGHNLGVDAVYEHGERATRQVGPANAALEHRVASENHRAAWAVERQRAGRVARRFEHLYLLARKRSMVSGEVSILSPKRAP